MRGKLDVTSLLEKKKPLTHENFVSSRVLQFFFSFFFFIPCFDLDSNNTNIPSSDSSQLHTSWSLPELVARAKLGTPLGANPLPAAPRELLGNPDNHQFTSPRPRETPS